MSRLRTGHNPGDWLTEEPGPARVHGKAYSSVPAENVGHMRPIVTLGGSYMDANSTTATGGWRAINRKPA
jgi:hypothetical protein